MAQDEGIAGVERSIRDTCVEVQLRGGLVWTVQGGLVEQIEVFLDPREALEAVDLDEG